MKSFALRKRVLRCQYCSREMKVSAAAHAENPFCRVCLPERVDRAGAGRRIDWKLVGDYFVPMLRSPRS